MDNHFALLSPDEVLSNLRCAAAKERQLTVECLLLLIEVDNRRLYLRTWSSLFVFCRRELNFSEGVAYYMMQVSRLAQRLPAVLEALRSGRVHLAGLRTLAPVLEEANCDALLAEATGKSRKSIKEIVARLAPKPAVADSIRKLPDPRPRPVAAPVALELSLAPPVAPAPASRPDPDQARARVEP